MTKTQVRKALKEILTKLEGVKDELDDLRVDIENTIEDIEPYEGKEELTAEQEDRKEWLDNIDYYLCDLYDAIDLTMNELEGQ